MQRSTFRMLARRDVRAGLMFMTVGVFGLWASRHYPIGTAVDMGTGYMPRLLCWILVILGAVIAGQGMLANGAMSEGAEVSRGRPFVFAPLSILVFAFTVERLGVVIATILLVAVGALAGRGLRTIEVAVTAGVLILFTVAVFIWGLGLTIRIWPEW
ncbi:MAG TPA: tripartite tricarboxylate transporter TctB family protein [Xanthobacteraceae bacterium]|nr:tripartite tricarboxylate transporter TctB family protein [Xanthobacteraceae bacterium]